jgi:hypothetical protein
MSPDLQSTLVTALIGAVPVAVAIAIRVRGPRGLIRGVDWSRVSDVDGLTHYLSLILLMIGALIILYGPIEVAARHDPALREAVGIVFGVLMMLLLLARWFVKRQFQRVDGRDGKR